MEEVTVSCPASISLLFRVCPNRNLVKMGSVGVGFTIDRLVKTSVQLSDRTKIWFNGKPIIFPTVTTVINYLTNKPVIIEIKSSLPLGFGFGVSGAAALSSSFAVNRLFHLNKSSSQLIKLAHIAEVINKTGLGSVGTQTTGGFLQKTAPGIPVFTRRFPFSGKKIYAVIIGKLETPKILNSSIKIKNINRAADFAIQTINRLTHPNLEKFIDLSYQSAKMSGLLINPTIVNIIEKIIHAGGHATMAKLGNVVISNIKPETKYQTEELIITEKGFLEK